MATQYNGNALLKSVDCSWRNGLVPGVGEFNYDRAVLHGTGIPYSCQLGPLLYRGTAESVRSQMNERDGTVTTVKCVDATDVLQRETVYAVFNMRDGKRRLYSVLPDQVISNGLLPPTIITDWSTQTRTYRGVHAWKIIAYLADLVGMQVVYSPNAKAQILWPTVADFEAYHADEPAPPPHDGTYWIQFDVDDVYQAHSYVWGLDWNNGKKVGNALLEVCDQLGIQFTCALSGVMDTLYFTAKGEEDMGSALYAGYLGDYAVSGSWGVDLNLRVDSLIEIIGDQAIHEVANVPLVPAWDQRDDTYWEDWALKYATFVAAMTEAELSPYLATVREVLDYLLGEDEPAAAIPAEWDGKPVEDMPAREYIKTFPFRLFKVDTPYENEIEVDGQDYALDLPLSDRLVTQPDIDSIVSVRRVITTKATANAAANTTNLDWTITTGYKLDRGLGLFMFDKMQLIWDEESGASVITDSIKATVGFFGLKYRSEFGSGDRKGSHPVEWLRRLYTHDHEADEWNADGLEHPLYYIAADAQGGEEEEPRESLNQRADDVAMQIAAIKLQQPGVIESGQREWRGQCGHVPSGWVQQVRVVIDARQGLTESIDVSNETSYRGDLEIEEIHRQVIQRQRDLAIAAERERAELDQADEERLIKAFEADLNKDGDGGRLDSDEEGGDDPKAQQYQAFTSHGRASVLLTSEAPTAGAVVALAPSLSEGGYFQEGAGGVGTVAVLLQDGAAGQRVPAKVTGIALARISGSVVQGNALVHDASSLALRTSTAEDDDLNLVATAKATGGGGEGIVLPVLLDAGSSSEDGQDAFAHANSHLCVITVDHGNGTYDVAEVGTDWTEDAVPVWEPATGVNYFHGFGVGRPVDVKQDGTGTWYIVTGYSTLVS